MWLYYCKLLTESTAILNIFKKGGFEQQALYLRLCKILSFSLGPPFAIDTKPESIAAIHAIAGNFTKLPMIKKLYLASLFDARIIEQDCYICFSFFSHKSISCRAGKRGSN